VDTEVRNELMAWSISERKEVYRNGKRRRNIWLIQGVK